MSTYSESLRRLAADLSSGGVPLDDVEARVCAALETPAPQGNPELLRAVARDFHQATRDLDNVSLDVGKLRRDMLPDVWEATAATTAAERMRTVEQHAEDSADVLSRIDGCLVRLAGGLSGAQTFDRAAREYVNTGLAVFRGLEEEARGEAVPLLATGIDKLADAREKFEQASGDAIRELMAYNHAAETIAVSSGADLSPAPGTVAYDRSQQDLDSLSPELVGYAITYAERLGVPVELVVALLMQEQPWYANAPGPVQWLGGEVTRQLGQWGHGDGGDTSVGVAQMKPPTAQRVLQEAGYGYFPEDELRNRLTRDDEFAVALAVMHLKQDLDAGMTEKEAYLAYSLDEDTGRRLTTPGDGLVQGSQDLSERSARYDANMQVINQAGDLREYYGLTPGQ